ncbi:melanoma inhibitory activity protein 3 isoform X2 [Sigmodon hispidus]
MILSDKASKYKDKIKNLQETNGILGDKAKSLNLLLESEREQSIKNRDLILESKKSIEKLKAVISMNASELSEIQSALSKAKLSEDIVKSECRRVQGENARLRKKKEQLQQQIEELNKSNSMLTEQIKSFESSQKDLEAALTHKDGNINALNSCITQLNCLEYVYVCVVPEGVSLRCLESQLKLPDIYPGDHSEKTKQRVKQMMDVSRKRIAVSLLKEDLKRLHFDLDTSVSTKCKLEEQIKKLEYDCSLLHTTKTGLEDEYKALKQKVLILIEIYCEKEIILQKKLSEEENEQKRLSAAGSLDRYLSRPRRSSETSGNHATSDPGLAPVMNSSLSYPTEAKDESKVNMAPKGPPPFPAVPPSGAPLGGPVPPPPMRYGPPPQLHGPYGPRPWPLPFVATIELSMRLRTYLLPPPSGIREHRDLLVDPREFLPGYVPFRPPGPLDPREYFIPGTPIPPPPHGPQDSQQPPSRPREEAPPSLPSSVQHHSEASKPSP